MISLYLQGKLSVKDIDMIIEQTKLIFNEDSNIKAPDIYVLYQQKIISLDLLNSMIERFYSDNNFYKIKNVWISPDIAEFFKKTSYVPLEVDYKSNIIIAGTIPEYIYDSIPVVGSYKIKTAVIKLYEYINLYIKYFGKNPEFIKELPVKDIFDMIVCEAIQLKASDITISQKENYIDVYYNVNKRKINSRKSIPNNIMVPLIKMLTSQTNSFPSMNSRKPIYFTINLDKNHRGRTVINYTYWGQTITIRILSNSLHDNTFESLNVPKDVQIFFLKNFANIIPGLKLIAGPTYSGKNTTIITLLDELHKQNDFKIVSVENPVEILTSYIEQIDAYTPDEFREAAVSTLRQNPDLVYISEMTSYTALETMKIANTGKAVISTIHANSIAEVPLRIKNITNMDMSEIIEIIDSMAYEELLPKKCHYCNDDGCEYCSKAGVVPVFNYLKMTKQLKRMLIDKSVPDIYKILDDKTNKTNEIERLYDKGVISKKTFEARSFLI